MSKREKRKKESILTFILNFVTAKETNSFSKYGSVENICAQIHHKYQLYIHFSL
jgi:hypothetical protein